MHTLAQLQAGELHGVTRLQLAEGLTHFPAEIFSLADSLEILDLSNNALSELPDDLHRLHRLKVIFCSNNRFRQLPACLGQCAELEMIGFKSNRIETVPAEALPVQTRWLILTDNLIAALPERIGQLHRLQKLMLAGNCLTELPGSLSQCHQLQLLRISANRLPQFPDVVLDLPQLSWLAFSGNPFCAERQPHDAFPQVAADDLYHHEVLGQGASGVIRRASWRHNPHGCSEQVAIKVFKGDVTSDGYPLDELEACLSIGQHPNMVTPLARVTGELQEALVMELIPADYLNLGQPPSLASCTRDVFTAGQSFDIATISGFVEQMESVVAHLRQCGISHGDLYAHNVLVNPAGHLLFGDLGAASRYHHLVDYQRQGIERMEQRALHCFIEDMLGLCVEQDRHTELYRQLAARLG
ncbi:protein kinase [Pokkaliibacter plantistimulans]|uniref:Protein kinase n=1 Tax=Pokkaliibacter plantistimulans TaxID=1635171 RepID=A0ABX5LUP1_9GAMM|nr:leucine-rich repeat-containing protein kinase family protein [Pokkaliibacter plantistimulans]PXF28888.1 protein kinase [Pokkaliibacter plantistimulans]